MRAAANRISANEPLGSSPVAPSATRRTGIAKPAALLALRVAMGFLMIWWGLNKIVSVGLSTAISDSFYFGLFSSGTLLRTFGAFQTALGILAVLGWFRHIALPLETLITGFTAASVWYAIIDPFNWYLGNERGFPHTQLFYSSAIIVTAALVLIAFRGEDRFALDNRLGRPRV